MPGPTKKKKDQRSHWRGIPEGKAGVMRHDADVPRFIPSLEPGDPGPGVLGRIKPPRIAMYLPERRVRVAAELVENPSPNGSFGYVGRFVMVQPDEQNALPPGTLVIALDQERLGTVVPETLRVFRWDEKGKTYQLVPRSGVGQTRTYVWAQLSEPGVYAVIGLNADPLVARTVGVLRYLEGWLTAAGPDRGRLQHRICQLILCAPDMREHMQDPTFVGAVAEANLRDGLPGFGPGGVPPEPPGQPGNICDICIGLDSGIAARPGRPFKIPEFDILWPVCISRTDRDGRWDVLPYGPQGAQILAVHAAVLRNGKVLYFAGDEHDAGQSAAGNVDHSRLWSPRTGVIETIGSPSHNLFCSNHAFLGDGRLLTAGGTQEWPVPIPGDPHGHAALGHFRGVRNATVFDPGAAPPANPWTAAAPMNFERGRTAGGGRWYPGLLTLANGRVFAMSGHPEKTDTRHNNIMVEVYNPATNTWSDEGDQPDAPDSYPRMHLLPDGQVFCLTPMAGQCRKWNPATRAWTDVAPGPAPEYAGFETTSVLLPLMPGDGYRARVLVVGASQAKILDLSAGVPTWQNTNLRTLFGSPRRRHANAVLLPDATVLVVGGSKSNQDVDAVLAAERFDPTNGQWSTLANAAVPRLYHSVALLLPDGRVWTAGSNFDCQSGLANRELRMEVYSPPYLFWGPRPTIASAPASLTVPTHFDIRTPQSNSIQLVALIRCGSATHAFNPDQRYVGLTIVSRTATKITVASPPNNSVAPPGYYLLVVLDSYGVPSVGRLIRVR